MNVARMTPQTANLGPLVVARTLSELRTKKETLKKGGMQTTLKDFVFFFVSSWELKKNPAAHNCGVCVT